MPSPKENGSVQVEKTRKPEIFQFTRQELPRRREENFFYCGLNNLSIVLEYYRRRNQLPSSATRKSLLPENLHQRFLEATRNGRLPIDAYEIADDEGTGTVLTPIIPKNVFASTHKPNIYGMAWLAEEISGGMLKATVIAGEKWEKLNAADPVDYLKAFILRKKIPVITRTRGHFRLAIGVDETRDVIKLYDTRRRKVIEVNEELFNESWGAQPSRYSDGLHHMMLAIQPNPKYSPPPQQKAG